MDWNQQRGNGGGYYGNNTPQGTGTSNALLTGQAVSRFTQQQQQKAQPQSYSNPSQGLQSFRQQQQQQQSASSFNDQGYGNANASLSSFANQQQDPRGQYSNYSNDDGGGVQSLGGYTQSPNTQQTSNILLGAGGGGQGQSQRSQQQQQQSQQQITAQAQLLELARALQQQGVTPQQGGSQQTGGYNNTRAQQVAQQQHQQGQGQSDLFSPQTIQKALSLIQQQQNQPAQQLIGQQQIGGGGSQQDLQQLLQAAVAAQTQGGVSKAKNDLSNLASLGLTNQLAGGGQLGGLNQGMLGSAVITAAQQLGGNLGYNQMRGFQGLGTQGGANHMGSSLNQYGSGQGLGGLSQSLSAQGLNAGMGIGRGGLQMGGRGGSGEMGSGGRGGGVLGRGGAMGGAGGRGGAMGGGRGAGLMGRGGAASGFGRGGNDSMGGGHNLNSMNQGGGWGGVNSGVSERQGGGGFRGSAMDRNTRGGGMGGTGGSSFGGGGGGMGRGGRDSMGRGGGAPTGSGPSRMMDRSDRNDSRSDRDRPPPHSIPSRDRDYDRDREKDRRDRDRDRDRDTKPRGDRDLKDSHERGGPSSRKDDRSQDRDKSKDQSDRSRDKDPRDTSSSSRREKSPSVERDREKKYSVKVHSHSYTHFEYDFTLIKRLFSRLCISPDFTRLVASWVQNLPITSPLNFVQPLQILCESKDGSTTPHPEDSPVLGPIKYNAKVILFSTFPHDQVASMFDGQTHISKVMKFLVSKDKDGIFCLGGSCNLDLDGDPSEDPDSLIRTAKRVVLEQAGLDLNPVQNWLRFAEIWYQRDLHEEVTVLFIPDISEIAPSMEEFIENWNNREKDVVKTDEPAQPATSAEVTTETTSDDVSVESSKPEEGQKTTGGDNKAQSAPTGSKPNLPPKKETPLPDSKEKEMPQNPAFCAVSAVEKVSKKKIMMISLDGLLDYDESDKLEATFELSLFAELFYFMLQRDFGYVIFQALTEHDAKEKEKKSTQTPTIGNKRSRNDDVSKDGVTQASSGETPENAMLKKMKLDHQPEIKEEQKDPQVEPTPAVATSAPPPPGGAEKMGVDTPAPAGEGENTTTVSKSEVLTPKIEEPQEEEEPILASRRVTDQTILSAFRFFDKTAVGYIRDDDLEQILHNLGLFLSKKVVHSLVGSVRTEYSAKSGRVYYERLAEKEVPIDDDITAETAPNE